MRDDWRERLRRLGFWAPPEPQFGGGWQGGGCGCCGVGCGSCSGDHPSQIEVTLADFGNNFGTDPNCCSDTVNGTYTLDFDQAKSSLLFLGNGQYHNCYWYYYAPEEDQCDIGDHNFEGIEIRLTPTTLIVRAGWLSGGNIIGATFYDSGETLPVDCVGFSSYDVPYFDKSSGFLCSVVAPPTCALTSL